MHVRTAPTRATTGKNLEGQSVNNVNIFERQ